MTHRIPQKQMPVEVTYDAGLIECGSLPVFLSSLGSHVTVFLSPLERSFWLNAMYKVHQVAIHVTARGDEARGRSPISYCTFVAAELACTEDGREGRLLLPLKELHETSNILPRARALQDELEECLMQVLHDDLNVEALHAPARYRIPDEWVWSVKSSLSGSGIAFNEGHWTRIVLSH